MAAEVIATGFVPSFAGMVANTRGAIFRATQQIGRRVLFDQRNAFAVGGHQLHGGKPWAQLKASTIRKKIKLGVARPAAPLVRFGRAQAAVKVQVKIRAAPDGWRWTIVAGNHMRYMEHHATGYKHKHDGFVPVRLPANITQQDMNDIRFVIQNYMRGSL